MRLLKYSFILALFWPLAVVIASQQKASKTQGEKVANSAKIESIVFGGGCFWGMEDILRKIPGVISTEVGYAGGQIDKPTYSLVSSGTTGHAEVVKVEFDATKVSFKELLDFFFRMHDPTTLNQQGNDKGTQYRSLILFNSEEQKAEVQKKIEEVNASKKWKNPVVTEVKSFTKFFPAEDYHQDYLVKNPEGYTCHFLRP